MHFEYFEFGNMAEKELPHDWSAKVRDSFDKIAPFYSECMRNEVHRVACYRNVDSIINSIIDREGYRNIIDIGVGDGSRVSGFGNTVKFGIDMALGILDIAKSNGVNVVAADMNQALPFRDGSMDVILYLSGDFGYVMGRQNGFEKRISVLDENFRILKPGGTLIMQVEYDLLSKVCYYWRRILPQGLEAGPFYLKGFNVVELENIFSASKFAGNTGNIPLEFIVKRSYRSDGLEIGKTRLKTTISDYSGSDLRHNSEEYLLLLTLRK